MTAATAAPPRPQPQLEQQITLAPADSVEITTLIDNNNDLLLRSD